VHNKSIRENIRKLHKKLAATLTITIFLLGTLAIMIPVQAHYTLGNSTNATPYHVNDFDPHVVGAIGYVWPGGGENTYSGYPGWTGNTAPPGPPGYIAPWADGAKFNPPGAPSFTWYQLAGNAYAPFGAILTGSTGDLIFAVNASNIDATVWKPDKADPTWGWGALDILIPPEFGNILPEQIVTSFSNDYCTVTVVTLSQFDRYAPGWTLISVQADGNCNGAVNTWLFNSTAIGTVAFATPQWYYVRINGVTAPTIAGKYFFKMFLGGVGTGYAECGTGCQPDYWLPTQNWPVVLVKGEVDPAIIWGTIFYGGWNTTLYNTPMKEAGKVWAKMTTKIDPYTGKTMTGGYLTDAVGYFNATANGHYEVEGVAPGIYDIYASAGGYPQQVIATGVTILKGQSLNLNGYLNPGIVIHGTVYTKHGFGEEPWPRNDYIKIEIYDAATVNHVVSKSAKLVSWSPLPCVAAGPAAPYASTSAHAYSTYYVDDASDCAGFLTAGLPFNSPVAFPYHEYATTPTATVTLADGTTTTVNDVVYNKPPVDEQGVGPAQRWDVLGGTTTPFTFQFGEKGKYGAPRDLDGHVPQVNATWVNGLTPGRYYARAWITQYVQSELDGATFHEVYFDVSALEWAGDVALPIDLHLTSYINKTVYFHNTPGTLMTDPITTGASAFQGELLDAAGVRWSWNVSKNFITYGTGTIGIITFYGFNYRWDGRDYGIPAGTYTPKVYAKGYRQQTFEQVSLSLSGAPLYISDHLYRGVGFNITVYSTDFEQPRVDRYWLYPEAPYSEIDLMITPGATSSSPYIRTDFSHQRAGYTWSAGSSSYTVKGVFWGGSGMGAAATMGGQERAVDPFVFSEGPVFAKGSGFDSGTYTFNAATYGYVQKKPFVISALKGSIADIKINLVIGVNITVALIFKKEKIITPTLYNMSARMRVFDDSGKLVGEWMTSQGVTVGASTFNYIPAGTSTLTVHIAGLPTDFTDPIWGAFTINDYPWLLNYGIDGYPNYQGGYSVEVDFVNWYRPNTLIGGSLMPVYYPAPPGLLMGESFHVVPGHPQNQFGWTEVDALSILGHSMAPNHLGPYAQERMWTLPNAHLSGESSGQWEVDLLGYLAGTVVGFTWSGEFRTQSWAMVSILGADNFTYISYSFDGYYEFYAAPGNYKMTISMPGYTSQTFPMVISSGQATSGGNIFLAESQIPIPEFTGLAVVAFSALAASLYLLRRRRR
jgi:hypothetical protein